jgi:hypothetical protein
MFLLAEGEAEAEAEGAESNSEHGSTESDRATKNADAWIPRYLNAHMPEDFVFYALLFSRK